MLKICKSTIKNFDFLKWFSTLYDLSIYLLNKKLSALKAAKEQNMVINKIEELKDSILLEGESIKNKIKQSIKKAKTKTHKKEIICKRKECFKKCSKTVW